MIFKMRFRLRTLLVVFAAMPALLGALAMYFLDRSDSSQQRKDRETRRMLHIVRAKMALSLGNSSVSGRPSDELLLSAIKKQTAAHCNVGVSAPHAPVDAWGQEIVVGVRANDIFARSIGANGIDDEGQGDDIQVSLWFPHSRRSAASSEPRSASGDDQEPPTDNRP